MDLKKRLLTAIEQRDRPLVHSAYAQQAWDADSNARLEEAMKRLAVLEDLVRDLTTSVLFSKWMESPSALASRKEMGFWLNWLGLTGTGVEVGVLKGEFSRHLLNTWKGTSLVSVDPWREFPSSEYVDIANVPQDQQELNLRETEARLLPFGERSRILRTTSAEAAAEFPDASIDFVYLDAQHHYQAVRDDILLWHSKVKPGGVLGGHDYLDGTIPSGVYGVKRAVDEFAAAEGYDLIITKDPDWPSWFVRIA